MRAAVGVVIELPQMHKLIDRAGIALEVADQLLVLPALLKGRKAEFLIEFHGLPHRANAECVGSQLVECHRKFLLESGLTIAGVPGAVLEDVRFAIDGEDHRAFVGVGLVERPYPSPDEFAGTADPVMIVERPLDDESLFDLLPVHGQGCTRLSLEQAGHLALRLVLVEDLDRNALELSRLPGDVLWLHIDRAADRRLRGWFLGYCRSFSHRVAHKFSFGCGCRADGNSRSREMFSHPILTLEEPLCIPQNCDAVKAGWRGKPRFCRRVADDANTPRSVATDRNGRNSLEPAPLRWS